jgi:hypothetical protein
VSGKVKGFAHLALLLPFVMIERWLDRALSRNH